METIGGRLLSSPQTNNFFTRSWRSLQRSSNAPVLGVFMCVLDSNVLENDSRRRRVYWRVETSPIKSVPHRARLKKGRTRRRARAVPKTAPVASRSIIQTPRAVNPTTASKTAGGMPFLCIKLSRTILFRLMPVESVLCRNQRSVLLEKQKAVVSTTWDASIAHLVSVHRLPPPWYM